jgi:phage/plasmid-associated DNA primase
METLTAEQYFTSLFPDAIERHTFVKSLNKIFFQNENPELYYWYGSGSNGKTMLFNILYTIFGSTDCVYAGSFKHIKSRLTEKTKLLFSGELSLSKRLCFSTIKSLIGGDKIFLNGKIRKQICNVLIIGNHEVLSNDAGIQRRVKTFRFKQVFHNTLVRSALVTNSLFLNNVKQYIKDF